MIGKIIDGAFVTPSANERAKIVITNPTDDVLKYIMGYKKVTEADKPEYDPETQILSPVYTESEDGISVAWTVEDIMQTAEVTEDVGTDM